MKNINIQDLFDDYDEEDYDDYHCQITDLDDDQISIECQQLDY